MKAIHRLSCGSGGAVFMYAALCVAVVGGPAVAQTGTEGATRSPATDVQTQKPQRVAPITFGRALPDHLDVPILDPVIVDYRDGGGIINAVGSVSAVAAPGDGCRFDAQCNDCNPCTIDSCDDEVCVGGNKDEFACETDNDCEGVCNGGVKNGLLCRDDLDCCGDGEAIVDGACDFHPCIAFTTGGAEGTGGNQCVNALIPDFACDTGSREGQLCDPNIDPTDLNNGCPASALDPLNPGTCVRRFEGGAECDDGISCNGRETCNVGTSTCVPGDPAESVFISEFRCDAGNRIGLGCDELGDPNIECPPAANEVDPGACVNTRVACEDAGLVCREDGATCALPCLLDIDCEDDGSPCTVEVCDPKLCVGGATPDVPCREDADCGAGTCSGGADGSCSVENPCGGGDCFNGSICVGGGLDGQPCTTAADCDDGTPAGGSCPTPPNGFSCLKGRCCTDGACARETFADCGGTFFGTAQACQTTNSGNFNVCPSYSAGIAPQDNAVVEVGSVIASQGIACDLVLTNLGDDYKIGDGTGFVTVTFVRFLISVQSGARLAFGFWDANGVPIVDTIVDGIGVSGPSIHTLDFDPPLVLPASGFAGLIVNGNFSPNGAFSWLSISDPVDVGMSDPSRMFVNGVPTDGSSFNLGQCSGGVRDGLWCNAASGDADCTDGVCGDVNDNLAFEIVAIPNGPDQTGACCISETGACAPKLPWVCKAGGDTFQSVGTTCAACVNDFTKACAVDTDCPACVGGSGDGQACSNDGDCPQGTCTGTATCFLTPPACLATACCNPDGTCDPTAGGLCSNDNSPCNNDLDCTGGATCEAQCPGSGVGSGFGTKCDPNACQQPVMTGGDNCFDVTVNVITVPGQGEPPVTITISGNNSTATFDDFGDGVCIGGSGAVTDAGTCKDGTACSIAADNCADTTNCLRDRCDPNIGICVDGSPCSVSANDCADQTTCQTDDAQCLGIGGGECTRLCGNARYNPAGANPNPGWWEAFHLDDCADIRLDFCTTDPFMEPNLNFLQAGCPCGAAVGFSGTLPPIGPPGADEDSEGTERGLPFCDEDNIWFTYRAVPPGTYFHPINSSANSNLASPPGRDYQFHITAGACRQAACCVNLCEGGTQDGQPCAPKVCRAGDTPGAECVEDGQCGAGGTCTNGGVTSCPGIAANCVDGTCVGGALDGLPCDDLTGEVDQCPGGGVCGATGCAVVNEMLCEAANGFWLAGRDFPDNICDGGASAGQECDTNADCPSANCIENLEFAGCGEGGGANPCDTGSCCAGPGACEDRSPDSGEPIRRIDCQAPRVFRGGGRCLFVPSPCPVCTVLTDDQCQNPNGGFIIGMDRLHANIAGAKVADDFIAGSPVIEQFCWWPAYLAITGGPFDCADPDGIFGPPEDDFEIRFFTDKNGFPDALVHELAPARVAASQWRAEGRRSWRYSAVFDPPLGGFIVGDKYWVEFSGRGNDDCRVTLLTSEDGNHFSLQEVDFFDEFPFWTFEDNAGFDQDFAMCIGGTSTPSIVTPPPVTGACCQCGGTCTDNVEWTTCLDFTDFIGPDEPGGLINPPPQINAAIPDGQFFADQTCAELNGGLGCINVGAGGGCPGAPSGVEGEDCVFPMVVNTGDNVSYNTVCSTTDGRTSYGDNPGCDVTNPNNFVNDQWFQYTATCSGNIQVDLCGDHDDQYDVMFAVFSNGTSECPTECPPPLDTILGGGCRDVECGADLRKPSFEFFGDPGTCYLIRVGGEEDSIATNIGGSGSGLLQIGCETTTCNLAEPVALEQVINSSGTKVTSSKNRYLSFSGGDPGRSQAIRIRLIAMPPPYDTWTVDDDNDGLGDTVLWVGAPFALSELSGKDDTTPPTFTAAPLECDLSSALFRDWSALGIIHVFGEAIIPGATYDIQVLDTTCSEFIPTHFSDPVTVVNPRWADAVGPFVAGQGVWSAPNGSVDVGGDVVAILDKFKNTPTAPKKARSDIQPRDLDFKISIVDVTRALDAFSGQQYPFAPSGTSACP